MVLRHFPFLSRCFWSCLRIQCLFGLFLKVVGLRVAFLTPPPLPYLKSGTRFEAPSCPSPLLFLFLSCLLAVSRSVAAAVFAAPVPLAPIFSFSFTFSYSFQPLSLRRFSDHPVFLLLPDGLVHLGKAPLFFFLFFTVSFPLSPPSHLVSALRQKPASTLSFFFLFPLPFLSSNGCFPAWKPLSQSTQCFCGAVVLCLPVPIPFLGRPPREKRKRATKIRTNKGSFEPCRSVLS